MPRKAASSAPPPTPPLQEPRLSPGRPKGRSTIPSASGYASSIEDEVARIKAMQPWRPKSSGITGDDSDITSEAAWARRTGGTAVEFLTAIFRGDVQEVDRDGNLRMPSLELRLEAAKLALDYHNRRMPTPVTKAKLDTTSTTASLAIDPRTLQNASDADLNAAIEALRKLNIEVTVMDAQA